MSTGRVFHSRIALGKKVRLYVPVLLSQLKHVVLSGRETASVGDRYDTTDRYS